MYKAGFQVLYNFTSTVTVVHESFQIIQQYGNTDEMALCSTKGSRLHEFLGSVMTRINSMYMQMMGYVCAAVNIFRLTRVL